MTTVTKETFWTQIVEDPTLYGTITTDDNLFNYRSDAVWQVMNETFITNGTNFEVTKWEELLGLNVTETTLNGRKAAILNHITENLPITIGIFEQLIKELADDDYELEYNETENNINVTCDEKYFSKIEEFVQRLIPIVSNVDYIVSLPAGYLAAEFLESTTGGGKDASPTIQVVDELPWSCGFDIEYEYTKPYMNATWSMVFLQYEAATNTYTFPPRVWDYNAMHVNRSIKVADFSGRVRALMNYKNSGKLIFNNQEISLDSVTKEVGSPIFLFKGFKGRIWSAKITEKAEIIRDLKPCLDDAGKPCFYDKITSTAFYNTDGKTLVVGLSLNRARKLSTLPAMGGTLTVSLPTGYESDSSVMSALETARSNGWTLTIQTYTPEAETSAAATFALRRVWVRRTQDENGTYVDANGNRFQVEWCVEIYSPENKTPEDLGYEQFRSVESAVEYWELTPYVDPTLEEQFNITNEEQ